MSEKEIPQRPFATGSKPGPDAVDHYLEEQGYYRKHVARDASSLFRTVSEQVFDIQTFHEKLRLDCVAFMEERQKEYSNEVDKNFFNYIHQLRRNRTYGSLLELRVLARMYRKNVILFEPTQNLQTTNSVYVQDDEYDSVNPLRVFYSHKDKHFDVIYTMDYVKKLADCQAIVYGMLYSDVYKLPDVQYAVERMLHDQEELTTLPLFDDPSMYKTQAGDVIAFDSYHDTNCVLTDPKTCHFHNQIDFDDVVNDHKDAITVVNRTDDPGRLKIFKPIDGFLYDEKKSCVRQLLDERITPFPYKVAKALDSSIYRNTEFELWSENRKEQRLKWLDSEYSPKQHLDDKWVIYDCSSYRKSYGKNREGKYERAIMDEKSYMALDDEMKKKYIILDPSAEPFKFHHLTDFNQFVPSKESLELTVMPVNTNFSRGGPKNKRGGGRYSNNNNNHSNSQHHFGYNNNQYHSNGGEGGQPVPNQPPQMTYVTEIERGGNFQTQEQQEPQTFYQQQQTVQAGYQETYGYEQQTIQAPQPSFYQPMALPPNWNNQLVPFIPPQTMQYATPLNYQQIMPYGNFTIPPPTAIVQPTGHGSFNGDSMNIIREAELASTTVNWKPKESNDSNGSDLPMNDIATLQFYYNLGVRYFLASGVQRRLETVAHQLEALNLSETSQNASTNEQPFNEQPSAAAEKVDAPPVPTNTPVTTKSVSQSGPPPGNRYPHNSHNYRRPFGSGQNCSRDHNRDGGNYRGNGNYKNHSRKEIKFNSNVKNAHKADTKSGSNGDHQSQTFHSSGGQTLTAGPAKNNIGASQNIPNIREKTSAGVPVPQYSPISPITQEGPQVFYQQQQQMQMVPIVDGTQTQQGFYQPFPAQQSFVPQQKQGVGMIYQMTEDGGYLLHQVPQPIQYQQYPYQLQPPTPIFYPVHNFSQPLMDGSVISSNDSGMVDPNSYHQQQQIQFYPPAQYQAPTSVPLFYTQSPLPLTPQIAQVAPLYPIQQSTQPTHSQQSSIVLIETQPTLNEQSTSIPSDETGADDIKSD